MNSIIASAIIGFAAVAQAAVLSTASGHARVVSNCQENVYISAVACDATMAPINAVLNSANPSFSQSFAEVTGGCGWAIKIGEDSSLPAGNILQYEYTWQGPGQQVWYDMSLVNQAGSPVFPWAFASSDTSRCNPDNDNYFAYETPETPSGMQIQCPDDVDLTLYLCGTGSESVTSVVSLSSTMAPSSTSTKAASTTSTSSSSSSSSSSSAPAPYTSSTSAAPSTSSAPSTSAAPSTTAAPSSSAPSTTASPTTLATSTRRGWAGWSFRQDNVAVSSTVSASSSVSATTAADGVVVTETAVFYVTEVATAYVTARDAAPSPAAHKRHAHGHPHGVHA